MNFLRKFVSLIVLVVAVAVLVGLCMDSSMKPIWQLFSQAFSPFSFQKVVQAVLAFMVIAQTPIILIMLGFIGFCIPKVKKQK